VLGYVEQPLRIQAIQPFAPALFDAYEPGFDENTEVTRRRWPTAAEAIGDLTCRHFATAKMQNKQNMSARRVRQRVENGVDVRQPTLRR
jgi:hypothetical protein